MTGPLPIEPRLSPAADLRAWRCLAGGVEFPAGDFLAVPEWDVAADTGWRGAIRQTRSESLRLRLRASGEPGLAFRTLARANVWPPLAVRLELLFADGEPGAITVFTGLLREWHMEPGALLVEARGDWPWDERALLCRDLATLAEGVAAGIAGPAWLPQVFGGNNGVPAPALFRAASARAKDPVPRTAAAIVLRAMPQAWPPAGRAQIDDEVLLYRAIQDNPPRLAQLTRGMARDHAAGAAVWLLGADDPEWVAADHAAEVLAVRAGAPDGEVVDDVNIVERSLSGRTATVIGRDRLPLVRTLAAVPSVRTLSAKASNWTLLAGTTALFAHEAFVGTTEPRGAILSAATSVILARWDADLTRDVRRHDALLAARFVFEMSAAPNWGASTRLRVTVSRGTASAVRDLAFHDTLAARGELAAAAARRTIVLKSPAADTSGRRTLWRFDAIHGDSIAAWVDAPNAIGASFDTWAARTESTAAVALRALLLRNQAPEERPLARLALFARVASPDGPRGVRLRLSIPGRVLHEWSADAESGWSVIGGWIAANGALPSELLHSDCRFEVALAAGGTLHVAGLWLQTEDADPEAAADKLADDVIPVTGTVRQALPFQAFDIDVSALLPAAPWDMFSPVPPSTTVRFELLDAPATFSLQLRGGTFATEALAASNVRATPLLFTRLRGRLADGDDQCDPVAVLRTLLEHDDFAGVPEDAIDGDAFDAAAETVATMGRRFRAWFAERLPLGDSILLAAGEAGCALSRGADGWRASALDAVATAEIPTQLGEGGLLEFPSALRSEPPEFVARTLRLVRGREAVLLAEHAREEGIGAQEWLLHWLSAGARSLAEVVFQRFGSATTRVETPVRLERLAAAPGDAARLSAPAFALHDQPAQCIGSRLHDGVLALAWRLGPEGETCWEGGPAILRREHAPAQWRLIVNGRTVALFGTRRVWMLRGVVKRKAAPFLATPGLSWNAEEGRVEIALPKFPLLPGIAIDGDGNLLVAGTLVEGVPVLAPAPECGVAVSPSHLALGTPELGAFAHFVDGINHLLLAGRLRERALP